MKKKIVKKEVIVNMGDFFHDGDDNPEPPTAEQIAYAKHQVLRDVATRVFNGRAGFIIKDGIPTLVDL